MLRPTAVREHTHVEIRTLSIGHFDVARSETTKVESIESPKTNAAGDDSHPRPFMHVSFATKLNWYQFKL